MLWFVPLFTASHRLCPRTSLQRLNQQRTATVFGDPLLGSAESAVGSRGVAGEPLEKSDIVEALAAHLEAHGMRDITALPNARVPIVKLVEADTQV